jgi:hypothetical protein
MLCIGDKNEGGSPPTLTHSERFILLALKKKRKRGLCCLKFGDRSNKTQIKLFIHNKIRKKNEEF